MALSDPVRCTVGARGDPRVGAEALGRSVIQKNKTNTNTIEKRVMEIEREKRRDLSAHFSLPLLSSSVSLPLSSFINTFLTVFSFAKGV